MRGLVCDRPLLHTCHPLFARTIMPVVAAVAPARVTSTLPADATVPGLFESPSAANCVPLGVRGSAARWFPGIVDAKFDGAVRIVRPARLADARRDRPCDPLCAVFQSGHRAMFRHHLSTRVTTSRMSLRSLSTPSPPIPLCGAHHRRSGRCGAHYLKTCWARRGQRLLARGTMGRKILFVTTEHRYDSWGAMVAFARRRYRRDRGSGHPLRTRGNRSLGLHAISRDHPHGHIRDPRFVDEWLAVAGRRPSVARVP